MPDGSRRRRFSSNPARRAYYADSRAKRFARRFGFGDCLNQSLSRSQAT